MKYFKRKKVVFVALYPKHISLRKATDCHKVQDSYFYEKRLQTVSEWAAKFECRGWC